MRGLKQQGISPFRMHCSLSASDGWGGGIWNGKDETEKEREKKVRRSKRGRACAVIGHRSSSAATTMKTEPTRDTRRPPCCLPCFLVGGPGGPRLPLYLPDSACVIPSFLTLIERNVNDSPKRT
uniref:Uncharacterized protein n=1 Tax=Rhizochromulina marina TaxID=1034831 RepID=A0A7S2S3C6_9STRA